MNELQYFNNDSLAASVWRGKYALSSENNPNDMHLRMAKEFLRIEQKYGTVDDEKKKHLSQYGQNRREHTLDSIMNLFKDFKFIVPQGSIMSVLGSDKIASLSNCFIVGQPYDSYGGILQKDEQLAQLMKRRGGVGIDISTLRPEETKVTNAAGTSTGAISFMERYSNTTREVAQNGRRGALMISIDVRHPDVEKFAKIKQDLTKVTGANISIQLRDDFMQAVEKDEDYILRWPCNQDLSYFSQDYLDSPYDTLVYLEDHTRNNEVFYIKKIKAKELWNTIIKGAHTSAEPGLIFKDQHIDYSPDGVYSEYRFVTTNPCVTQDTLILTDKGYYPIIDLVDESVNVWNGKEFTEVVPKITGTNQEILKITLSDGRELKCTPYHKWYLWEGSTRDGKSVIKEAQNLIIGDKIEKYQLPITEYGTTVPTDIAYTQGFYSGDGVKNSNTIWLYNEKIEISQFMKGQLAKTTYNTSTGSTRKHFKVDFKLNAKDWVPYNEYSIKSRIDWLAGLIDSDGSSTKEGGLQIWSIDKTFLTNVQYLLSTLGINSKITIGKEKTLKSMPDGKGDYKQYQCQESNRLLVSAFEMQELLKLGLITHRVNFTKFNPNREASRFITIVSIEKQDLLEEYVYCFNEPKENKGTFNGILTGQCGEIGMSPYDACRLLAINFYNIVKNHFTNDAAIDYDLLYSIAFEMQRFADDIVDLELEQITKILAKIDSDPEPEEVKRVERELWENIKTVAKNSRRTGSGFTALGDMLAALNLKYDSDEALEVITNVMRTKFMAELDCTIDLAIERGSFKGWNKTKEYGFDYDEGLIFTGIGMNKFFHDLYQEFPEQVVRMIKWGRRNVSTSTVAPTGSVSLLTQTTSGLEPLFSWGYMRRKKVNPGEKDVRVDFVDQNGDNWMEYPVLHPKFKDWLYSQHKSLSIPRLGIESTELVDPTLWSKEILEEAFKQSPWYGSTANDIDWRKRVQIQAIIQKYTTHSISTTLNLPNETTEEEVSGIYLHSWNLGLKGQTIYRDGSRSGVLVNLDTPSTSKINDEFVQHDAPKRPKELPCVIHHTKSKGKDYTVIVGLLDNSPYELFIVPIKIASDHKSGTLIKLKSATYNLVYSLDEQIMIMRDITENMTDEQEAITRLISTGLRHGANIKFIVEQLQKTQGDLNSFVRVIARILKSYIPNGEKSTIKCNECGSEEVVFQEGCLTCMNCGNSKCG